MTVLSSTNRNDYIGANSVGPFAYTFKIFADTDLVVTTRDLSGNETTLVLNSDYTVTGAGVSTGGAHVIGDRHTNFIPSELGTSFSPTPTYSAGKYVLDGWLCSVAGTPGTWLQRRTLTGN